MTAMAIDSISLNGSSHDIIKEESLFAQHKVDIKQEPDENVSLCDELEKKLKVKCGEVFVLFGEQFILVCTFCDGNFNNMQLLGEHLFEKHAQEFFKKDEDEIEPKISKAIKTEPVETNAPKGGVCELTNAKSNDWEKWEIQMLNTNVLDNPDIKDELHLNCNDSFVDVISEQSDQDSQLKEQLKRHLQIYSVGIPGNDNDPELFCEICKRQFDTKKTFSNHQRRHRQFPQAKVQVSDRTTDSDSNIAKIPDRYCDLCQQFFRYKKDLYAHADSHDSIPSVLQGDNEFLKCKYCWKEFSKYSERKTHETTHTGPRPYECPYCHKGFVSNLSRKSHLRVHTGESPHQCDQCLKVFRDKYDLRRHIKRHLNIRDFACELCEKKFYHKYHLKLHIEIHRKDRPYACEDGKSFVVLPQLLDHQRKHTGKKNIKCEVCGRLFYFKSALKEHMPSHSDEKPFECNICAKRFSRVPAMQKHMELHSNIKKYVCNICGKAFAQDSGLYVHKKTHARQLK